jgi:D-amino-acid dehydrogenase
VPSGETDALIVGGGIVGLACAEALSRRGRSVRVVERDRVGRGASWANCGLITPGHALPLAHPGVLRRAVADLFRRDAPIRIRPRLDPGLLAWLWRWFRSSSAERARHGAAARAALLADSRRRLAALVWDGALQCEWQESGLLVIHRTEASFEEAREEDELLAELGVEVRRLDRDALASFEPALRDGHAGGRFWPADAHLRPERLVEALARLLAGRQVILEERAEVLSFATERGRVTGAQTSRGPLRARDTILAAGAWSPRLARGLGLHLPIQPGKGYTITSARPRLAPRRPLLLFERKVAITPWNDSYRIGSTMEFAGYDTSFDRRRLGALVQGARELLRDEALPAGAVEEWFGWRPMTCDDLPVLGRAPGRPGLWLATGHGMLGTSLSAGTGELMAALICGEPPPVDPRPFSLERFG